MTAGKRMERKRSNAFITARKGFCYLTIKYARRNHEMMRIRNYRIEADEKRHMRRLYRNWPRNAKPAGATAPDGETRRPAAIRVANRCFTASTHPAPVPSTPTTCRPAPTASECCSMPSSKSTAA